MKIRKGNRELTALGTRRPQPIQLESWVTQWFYGVSRNCCVVIVVSLHNRPGKEKPFFQNKGPACDWLVKNADHRDWLIGSSRTCNRFVICPCRDVIAWPVRYPPLGPEYMTVTSCGRLMRKKTQSYTFPYHKVHPRARISQQYKRI